MIGAAAFFIVFIMAWLVGYIVRFMANRRSREFGTYLLLGVSGRRLAGMFIRENLILGGIAFALGLLPGMFFQQVLTSMFMGTMDKAYHLKAEISIWNILLTLGIYLVIFWIALLRAGRRLKKLNIRELMNAERANEEIRQKHISEKTLLFPMAVIYILIFMLLLWNNRINNANSSVPGTFWFRISSVHRNCSNCVPVCRQRRAKDLQERQCISDQAVFLQDPYHAVYYGNPDGPFYCGSSCKQYCSYVYGLSDQYDGTGKSF